jgi:hypothetical protein
MNHIRQLSEDLSGVLAYGRGDAGTTNALWRCCHHCNRRQIASFAGLATSLKVIGDNGINAMLDRAGATPFVGQG